MEFQPITLGDRDKIKRALAASECLNCEFSFGNLYSWGNAGGAEIAFWKDTMIVRLNGRVSLPIGPDRSEAFTALRAAGKTKLFSVDEKDFEWLRGHVGKFEATYDRDWSDYLYDTLSLQQLTGKKLAAKRNHINAFLKANEQWHTEDITPENLPAVRAFLDQWAALHAQNADESARHEEQMARLMLSDFFDLALEGLLLYAGENVVAISLGEPISPLCYCVHVEKALPDVRGAYPLINREFARRYCTGYSYINREDDAGEPGLRKAKLSYEPAMLLNKYEIVLED